LTILAAECTTLLAHLPAATLSLRLRLVFQTSHGWNRPPGMLRPATRCGGPARLAPPVVLADHAELSPPAHLLVTAGVLLRRRPRLVNAAPPAKPHPSFGSSRGWPRALRGLRPSRRELLDPTAARPFIYPTGLKIDTKPNEQRTLVRSAGLECCFGIAQAMEEVAKQPVLLGQGTVAAGVAGWTPAAGASRGAWTCRTPPRGGGGPELRRATALRSEPILLGASARPAAPRSPVRPGAGHNNRARLSTLMLGYE